MGFMNLDQLAITHYLGPRRPSPAASWPSTIAQRNERLERLVEAFVIALVGTELGITEGLVRSQRDPAPYRRFDCDRRALLYLRIRPKKDLIRIDLAGHWLAPARNALSLGRSRGVLAIRRPEDVLPAVQVVVGTILTTRGEGPDRSKLQ
jgi:hypothetical protein